jgi:8-oxo-dGTP diphosphatase
MTVRNTNIPEVQIVFKKWNQILLNLRHNTGYMDNMYWLVAWHVEKWETFTQGGIREALEEAWVILKPEQMKYVHTVHRKKNDEEMRIWVIFVVENWDGDIVNTEPHKCKELIWCDVQSLPKNTIPYIKVCLENIEKGMYYSETD